MSDISSSIWNQDGNGEWKLYFNTDSNIPSLPLQNKDEQKLKKTNINISDKNLVLGTLVMTPKGIGRLIKNIDGIAHIKFNEEIKEHQFKAEEISNVFNCYITFILKDNIDTIRLKLKVSGNVENIFEELSKLNKINQAKYINYSLIYNKTILQNETTFEQLKLQNNTKMLIIEKLETEFKISRFGFVQRYWLSYNSDGICFSPSENIKLLGISLYCSYDNKIINGTIKITEGQMFNGKVLYEEIADIQPSSNRLSPTNKIIFRRPVICKKNNDYGIIFITNIKANTFSGSKGKKIVEGERGINFTFKYLQGNRGGTSIEIGNFPDIYYCFC